MLETPPRAWGRPAGAGRRHLRDGNTPTGVGKTAYHGGGMGPGWKHPHGRGEDVYRGSEVWLLLETPPRAWGRPFRNWRWEMRRRNTPTGVGKTRSPSCHWRRMEKHPHGRGEDAAFFSIAASILETPPRAWGRPWRRPGGGWSARNTPTGVGKTAVTADTRAASCETPPRAWGRLSRESFGRRKTRNTPTGVGKTRLSAKTNTSTRKHPHGRGEDQIIGRPRDFALETPPRAWGRHHRSGGQAGAGRNTPTGVGKTLRPPGSRVTP